MYCDCNYYTSKPIIITRKVLASKAVPQPKSQARQNMQRLMIGFMKHADIPLNVMVLMTLFNLDWAVKSYGHKFGLPFTYYNSVTSVTCKCKGFLYARKTLNGVVMNS